MIKCCNFCVPTCQHCIHGEFEKLELNGRIYTGEVESCKLHPDQGIDASYWCKDFHCFREVQNANAHLFINASSNI